MDLIFLSLTKILGTKQGLKARNVEPEAFICLQEMEATCDTHQEMLLNLQVLPLYSMELSCIRQLLMFSSIDAI